MKRGHRPKATSSVPARTTTITASQCISLASRTCDQVMELAIALNAYLALECLVEPAYVDEERASVPPSRVQLSSLLHAVNVEVQRKISALAELTTLLQAQANMDAALGR